MRRGRHQNPEVGNNECFDAFLYMSPGPPSVLFKHTDGLARHTFCFLDIIYNKYIISQELQRLCTMQIKTQLYIRRDGSERKCV